MELNIESQKQEFLTICRATIKREGLEELLDWLCKADFFAAPASTHYHGGYAGGLCQHSIDVYQYAKRLLFLMDKAPTEESVAIACLFHDLCKVNLYKVDKRNQKINGEWKEVPYYVIDERFHFGGHGGRFYNWIFSEDRKPYNSYGNGSAMRVSPCAWIKEKAYSYLDEPLKDVLRRWKKFVPHQYPG